MSLKTAKNLGEPRLSSKKVVSWKKKCKGTWARAEEEAVKSSRWRFLGLSFKPDYSTGDTETIRRHNFRVWEDQLDVPMAPWLSTIIWYPRLLFAKTSIAFALSLLNNFMISLDRLSSLIFVWSIVVMGLASKAPTFSISLFSDRGKQGEILGCQEPLVVFFKKFQADF